MQKWEHGLARIPLAEKKRLKPIEWRSLDEVREVLDEWGALGWELVAVIPDSTWHQGDVGSEDLAGLFCVFKRSLPDADE